MHGNHLSMILGILIFLSGKYFINEMRALKKSKKRDSSAKFRI